MSTSVHDDTNLVRIAGIHNSLIAVFYCLVVSIAHCSAVLLLLCAVVISAQLVCRPMCVLKETTHVLKYSFILCKFSRDVNCDFFSRRISASGAHKRSIRERKTNHVMGSRISFV